jgi:FlaA1/EpsC-like NDP-sugar epimerase
MTFGSFIQLILTLPRSVKIAIVITLDVLICIFTTWFSFYLRLGEWIPFFGSSTWKPEFASSVSFILLIPLFFLSGMYRSIFRYSGISVAISTFKIILIYALFFSCVFTGFGILGIPRTVGLIQPILLLLFIFASRAFACYWLGGMYQNYFRKEVITKVLIYGAGIEGRQLADALVNSQEMSVVGFVDDDPYLIGQVLNGQPIYAINDLEGLTKNLGIKVVLLAIPWVSQQRRNQVIKKITQLKIIVRTLPSVNELAHGRLQNTSLRNLDIGDLLGRDPIPPNDSLLKTKISNKIVMVTGAGGSIGSELCKQILNLKPRILLLIDASEYALYSIDNILKEQQENKITEIIPLLAMVQDSSRISLIIETWMPDTIYHAAAYKHVPLVEQNPIEGISNNVFGTLVLAELAARYQVSDFVLISTDKAVRPTNIMGATKRLSEMILQSLNSIHQSTRFSMVRFGNVLGSSGSVVPRFSAQIHRGGPITLTHLEITRYFMTIPEAAQLVIQACAMAKGGEVFVLDMGEPVRIFELAKNMVELSGHSLKSADNQGGDIGIEITGLRPGEKLYEELLIGNDPQQTDHPRIMKASEDYLEWKILAVQLEELKTTILKRDVLGSIVNLNKIVTNYNRSDNFNDWVYLQNLRE